MGNATTKNNEDPGRGRKSSLKSQQDETKDSASGIEGTGLMTNQDVAKAEEAVAEARKAFLEGNKFFGASNLDAAKIHYSWALKVLQNKLTNVEHHKATALSNIGLIEFIEGRYSEAKALLNEAYSLRKNWALKTPSAKLLYPVDDNYGSMAGLESLHVELARDHQLMFGRSSNAGQKRLTVTLKQHEIVDIITGDSLNNLAACMEMMGNFEEAKPLYEESLRLRKLVYSEVSLKSAESMQTLGIVMSSMGHLREAENMFRTAYGIYVELLGDESPEVAVSQNNLAFILCHLGSVEAAQELLTQTVTSRTIMYGEDHYFTRSSCENLKYVINKRRSILTYEQREKANLKKKKGKKITEEDKMQKVKEKDKVDESKLDDKEDLRTQRMQVACVEKNKGTTNEVNGEYFTEIPLGNDTTEERKYPTKKNSKPKNINEVIITGMCCSII